MSTMPPGEPDWAYVIETPDQSTMQSLRRIAEAALWYAKQGNDNAEVRHWEATVRWLKNV